MENYAVDTINLAITAVLIILNGFFVAAEFALVKVSEGRIKTMMRENQPFASVAMWLYKRQNMALSACQMGITMASLALGWIGEPAIAHLLTPVLEMMGITNQGLIHGIALTIAFTAITSLHIIVGEQFPKIYAIRKPIPVVGWSSVPLKFFYIIFFPFMWVLDRVTAWLLNFVGVDSNASHETIVTNEEIRASLHHKYHRGDLSSQMHQILDSALKFDQQVAHEIMVPRSQIIIYNLEKSVKDNLTIIKESRHTRFPVCVGSLDHIEGLIHIKELIGKQLQNSEELKKIFRPMMFIPESLPIHSLLMEFRKSKQHMACVEDEHGTVVGMVTLENVIEQLVGSVQDEFDDEKPAIVKQKDGQYIVEGYASLYSVNTALDTKLQSEYADTISGYIIEKFGSAISTGKKFDLDEKVTCEILTVSGRRVDQVKITKHKNL